MKIILDFEDFEIFIQSTKWKFLDAGIQDISTSISIVVKIEEMSPEEMVMKVTHM